MPAYKVGEAASYARISPQTVAAWEATYSHKPRALTGRAPRAGLTFLQLIEVAVVAELRREGVRLERIRSARSYFAKRLNTKFPFAFEKFKTDGVDILLEDQSSDGEILPDRLVVANENGQLIWADFLENRLREFNYGEDGFVVRWFLNGTDSDVFIDPRLCFGSPAIKGISTRAIKNEWATGQSLEEISEDFDLDVGEVKEALRFEGMYLDNAGAA